MERDLCPRGEACQRYARDGLVVKRSDNDLKVFNEFSKQMQSTQEQPVTRKFFTKEDTSSAMKARSRKKFAIHFHSRLFAQYEACIEKSLEKDLQTVTSLLNNATEAVLAGLQDDHSE
ncbi:unnamed protein product [Clavelina lepadiformis]|uniref:Uncharacterized protein n=1 Tax=Clavelina lepadiformis TaxID=159417 RepID=A0ABP0G4C4_CLALP